MKIGIWYFYNDTLDATWRNPISQALNISLSRLRAYFGTTWDFQFIKEFRTLVRYDKAIMPNKCIEAVTELASSDPNFKADYNNCELPFFIFANATDAFSFDYKSPAWCSDSAFRHEIEGLVVIEHEIGHTFGLPDHVKPWAKPYYEQCMMGNPYVGGIQLCPECEPKFVLSNYKKHPYLNIVNNVSDEIPIIPQEPPVEQTLPDPYTPPPTGPENIGISAVSAYAYWAGGIPQKMTEYNTWPSDRIIICAFKIANHEMSSRAISIVMEFADQKSKAMTISPGQVGEVNFVLEPMAMGLYTFSLKVFESGNLFGYETTQMNVTQSEPPIIPVYQLTKVKYGPRTSELLILGSLVTIGGALILSLLFKRRL